MWHRIAWGNDGDHPYLAYVKGVIGASIQKAVQHGAQADQPNRGHFGRLERSTVCSIHAPSSAGGLALPLGRFPTMIAIAYDDAAGWREIIPQVPTVLTHDEGCGIGRTRTILFLSYGAQLMSDTTVLDQFGQHITHHVRDAMIVWFDHIVAGTRRDIYSRYLSSRLQSLSPECVSVVAEVLPTIVDATIAVFLQQFDGDDRLRIEMRDGDGAFVDLNTLTDGLEAEYSFAAGWAATFSRQRPNIVHQEADRLFNQHAQASDDAAST